MIGEESRGRSIQKQNDDDDERPEGGVSRSDDDGHDDDLVDRCDASMVMIMLMVHLPCMMMPCC